MARYKKNKRKESTMRWSKIIVLSYGGPIPAILRKWNRLLPGCQKNSYEIQGWFSDKCYFGIVVHWINLANKRQNDEIPQTIIKVFLLSASLSAHPGRRNTTLLASYYFKRFHSAYYYNECLRHRNACWVYIQRPTPLSRANPHLHCSTGGTNLHNFVWNRVHSSDNLCFR